MNRTQWGEGNPHPLCAHLRELRTKQGKYGWSLSAVEARFGVPASVLGSYERGSRQPTVATLDDLLCRLYGKRLTVVDLEEPSVPSSALSPVEALVELRRVSFGLEEWDRITRPAA